MRHEEDRADDRPAGGGKPPTTAMNTISTDSEIGEHRVRIDVAEIERVEAAGESDDEGGEHQGHDARAHGVDADGLGAVDVLAHRCQIGAEPRAGDDDR